VDIEKDMTVTRSTPERVERIINQMLADILDDYFANPYQELLHLLRKEVNAAVFISIHMRRGNAKMNQAE
jgi:hypothetical protein